MTNEDEQLYKKAMARALHLLERADKTEKQMRDKLAGVYPPEVVEQTIAYLLERHYLDDLRFARRYMEIKGETKSRRMLVQELTAKGVSRDVIEEAQDALADETQEALLLRLAEKQFQKRGLTAGTAPREEQRKIGDALLRRGFSYGEIRKAMARLLEREQSA